jgi:acetyltransferase, GNAT family
MLTLIKRERRFMQGYKEYCQEFHDNNILWFQPTNPKLINENWFERTFDWYDKKEQGRLSGYPKSLHYWAVDEDMFIGEFQLRPELTEEIMLRYGSIGYSVRVSEQGKGYGKEILKQGLEIAKEYGLEKVLLNINEKNIVSAHICETFGGILMDKIVVDREESKQVERRYWIYL